ncbi:histidine phosphatase family protein [Streptococcus dysgalactiae]|uniref:histidine phosphatase family protein n=1 Tax=Streptococcus dysgalactiae TaxID=1334 RepID=UPI0010CABB36|nr:histidine phosphatase family protein [Streptococcus dysgalactiae]VTT06361.1 phosphoglycerate mutase family protein [Streptococcus dysgalactiae subsp. equisimilis]
MTKIFYLMRYGQTRFNAQGRIQGACDSPLTELGIEQAKAARAYFEREGISFDRIYTSTQERACDTAELATGRENYIRLKGLKEWDFGSFEAHQEYLNPHLFREGGSGYRDYFVAYGGESNVQVYERVGETIRKALDESNIEETLLFVSHGGAIGQFNSNVVKNSLKPKSRFTNCCVLKIAYENGDFEVLSGFNPVTNESIFED